MIQIEDKSKTEESNERITFMSLEEFLDIAKELKNSNVEFSTVVIDSYNVIKGNKGYI